MVSAVEVAKSVQEEEADGYGGGLSIGLTPEGLFVSSKGTILTPFGVSLQRILILAEILTHLEEDGITKARCEEVIGELKRACEEIGISENRAPITLTAQFKRLVNQRDGSICKNEK